MKVRRNDCFRKPNLHTARNRKYKMERVGRALVTNTRHILNLNLFAQYILNGRISQIDKLKMCREQQLPKDELSDTDTLFEDIRSPGNEEKSSDSKPYSFANVNEIMSYTELYTPDIRLRDDHLKNCSPINQVVDSHSIRSPNQDTHMALSISPSIMNENCDYNVALYGTDWEDCSFNDDDKGDDSSFERVSKDLLMPSYLMKASRLLERN